MQSWIYGESKEVADNLESLYLNFSKDGKDLAISQVLIKKIPLIGNIMRVNRGPLLINEHKEGYEDVFVECLKLLIEECKKRKALMIQIAPEIS